MLASSIKTGIYFIWHEEMHNDTINKVLFIHINFRMATAININIEYKTMSCMKSNFIESPKLIFFFNHQLKYATIYEQKCGVIRETNIY